MCAGKHPPKSNWGADNNAGGSEAVCLLHMTLNNAHAYLQRCLVLLAQKLDIGRDDITQAHQDDIAGDQLRRFYS